MVDKRPYEARATVARLLMNFISGTVTDIEKVRKF
jgi:hypothetical protein